MKEAYEALSEEQRKASPARIVGYKGTVAILSIDYPLVMTTAVELRRRHIVDSKAAALEYAYDHVLKTKTPEWHRTGEVHLDKDDKKIAAMCSMQGDSNKMVPAK